MMALRHRTASFQCLATCAFRAQAILLALVWTPAIANASATIDVLWNGTDARTTLATSSSAVAHVIVTANAGGVSVAAVTVAYSGASVVSFASNPDGDGSPTQALPIQFGDTTDSGSELQNLNAASIPFFMGTGLAAGNSWLVGTIVFHKNALPGRFEIRPFVRDGAQFPDTIDNLNTIDISSTSVFHPATLVPEIGGTAATGVAIASLLGLQYARRNRRGPRGGRSSYR